MSDIEITSVEDLEKLAALLAAAKEKSNADNDDDDKSDDDESDDDDDSDDDDEEDDDDDDEDDEEEEESAEAVEAVPVPVSKVSDVVSPDHPQHLRLIEALLFAGTQALDEKDLADRLPNDANLPVLLADITELYANRGVNVVKVANGYAIRTAADLSEKLKIEKPVTRKLSRAAIETLAIIAYHQPVTRTEIEEIRGVIVNRGILDTLMESGWIRPKGHKQTPGRPATWVTTPEFLVHFGLDGLADLPGIDELKAAGLLDPRPAASLTDMVADSVPAESEDEAEDDGDDDADADDDRGDEVEALASDAETDPPAST